MALPIGLNVISMGARALGVREDPLLACNFMLELDGLLTGGFMHVDGLECTLTTQDHFEGGVNGYAHKLIGGATYPNLVLSRGYTGGDALWRWFDRVRKGEVRRKNGTLVMLDGEFVPVKWWDIRDALPVRWVGPTFDANQAAEVAVERLELVHRGITQSALSQLTSIAHAGLAAARDLSGGKF